MARLNKALDCICAMNATAFAFLAGAALAIYQAYVTYRVARSLGLSRGQKLAQGMLIWLLPLLGAVVAHIMLGHDFEARPSDRNFTPQAPNDGGPTD